MSVLFNQTLILCLGSNFHSKSMEENSDIFLEYTTFTKLISTNSFPTQYKTLQATSYVERIVKQAGRDIGNLFEKWVLNMHEDVLSNRTSTTKYFNPTWTCKTRKVHSLSPTQDHYTYSPANDHQVNEGRSIFRFGNIDRKPIGRRSREDQKAKLCYQAV
ncbi:hypothetical protein FGO68_gene4045 [Halteria grandinella]|uniref:Uncharacterized protein n=1 Tax=Halteria grandinella TaxID=5974 RepID=A0A8J8P1A7_HALGN|nr:hypothetical protein FGO68_gene4045 [Halteria grandinella]